MHALSLTKAFTVCLMGIYLIGCSPTYHKNKADKEVYEILSKAQKSVFSKNKPFTINTATSAQSRDNITNNAILKRSNNKGSAKLSIKETLNYAIANSRTYQTKKERLYLTALSLSDTKETFALTPRSSISGDVSRQSDGDLLLNTGSQNSLFKLLKGGGSISLTLANDLLRYFTGGSSRSIASTISMRLSQPLLRGRGAHIAAERLTQSSRNVIYQIRDYAAFQQNFSREIVIDYLSLIQQEERVNNQRKNYESRKANYEYLQARSIDRASSSEVAQAKQDVLQAETSHIQAQATYKNTLDSFKINIGLPSAIELTLEKKELDKLGKSGLRPFKYSEQEAYQLALKYRAGILNAVDEFEDSRRNIILAATSLKTNLNFVSNASLSNSGDRWERLNFDDLSTSIGLELDFPVNRKRQRNDYRRALMRFDSTARSLSQSHDELRNLISRRFRELEQFRNNYEIQLGAVKLAERRVEENELRLKMGVLIFRRLSEAQDSLISAQNAVTAALVNYQESRLRLYEEIGLLDIDESEFWLK